MDRGRKIVWAPSAVQDLRDAFDYIQLDNPSAAAAWVQRLVEGVEKLARFPKLGHFIPEIGKSRYRELIVGEYRIFHEIREKEVLIFRVFHSRRLFPD